MDTLDLFFVIASCILKRRGWGGTVTINADEGGESGAMFKDDSERESYLWNRRKDGITTVVEDLVQPVVLWEQSIKDVEFERRRKAVTSPGFSFSTAGLLFPYHLGVAHCLIEKGYIKVQSDLKVKRKTNPFESRSPNSTSAPPSNPYTSNLYASDSTASGTSLSKPKEAKMHRKDKQCST